MEFSAEFHDFFQQVRAHSCCMQCCLPLFMKHTTFLLTCCLHLFMKHATFLLQCCLPLFMKHATFLLQCCLHLFKACHVPVAMLPASIYEAYHVPVVMLPSEACNVPVAMCLPLFMPHSYCNAACLYFYEACHIPIASLQCSLQYPKAMSQNKIPFNAQ